MLLSFCVTADGFWVQKESVFFFRSVSSSMATMFYTGVYGLHKLDSINDYKTLLKIPNLGVERGWSQEELGQVMGSEFDQDTSCGDLKELVEILY